jgi:phosphatidylethanolamine-binding protein (PEBP) family uncharacterized protein
MRRRAVHAHLTGIQGWRRVAVNSPARIPRAPTRRAQGRTFPRRSRGPTRRRQPAAFAILMFDPDGANGLGSVHWVAYGIPPTKTSFAEGEASTPNRLLQCFYIYGGWALL